MCYQNMKLIKSWPNACRRVGMDAGYRSTIYSIPIMDQSVILGKQGEIWKMYLKYCTNGRSSRRSKRRSWQQQNRWYSEIYLNEWFHRQQHQTIAPQTSHYFFPPERYHLTMQSIKLYNPNSPNLHLSSLASTYSLSEDINPLNYQLTMDDFIALTQSDGHPGSIYHNISVLGTASLSAIHHPGRIAQPLSRPNHSVRF